MIRKKSMFFYDSSHFVLLDEVVLHVKSTQKINFRRKKIVSQHEAILGPLKANPFNAETKTFL